MATGKSKAGKAKVVKVNAVKKAITPVVKPYTKTELLSCLAEGTGLGKKDVGAVISELVSVVERHMRKKAAGAFTLPGLLKIKTIKKAATKARKGINPFTGLETMFKAKPARTVVKIQALKGLKSMANT